MIARARSPSLRKRARRQTHMRGAIQRVAQTCCSLVRPAALFPLAKYAKSHPYTCLLQRCCGGCDEQCAPCGRVVRKACLGSLTRDATALRSSSSLLGQSLAARWQTHSVSNVRARASYERDGNVRAAGGDFNLTTAEIQIQIQNILVLADILVLAEGTSTARDQ